MFGGLACKTTYHLNYKVVGNERIYYDYVSGLPNVLQVSDHYFVDHKLADLWKMMMHTSWFDLIPGPADFTC